MENKNNQTRLIIIGVAILVVMLVGVTYAFFNYTRTGGENTVRTGRINFLSNQANALTLTNIFPMASSEAANAELDQVSIRIEGDTTYAGGEEFEITIVDVSNTVGVSPNEKIIPISYIATYTPTASGDAIGSAAVSDYYTERGHSSTVYELTSEGEVSNGKQVLVGYIPQNGEIDGTLKISAYLDSSKIAITDTYPEELTDTNNDGALDGTTSSWVGDRVVLTTTEWNALASTPLSFKIRVESNEDTWVEKSIRAYNKIIEDVLTPENPINFANISSSSNGEGLYILPGTENNTNPIYYYRGAINNNNVIFGDFCWQMVRTTDTGGIKMIYNGAVTGNGKTCENTNYVDRILSSITAFNSQYGTAADVGYMKNARYSYTYGTPASGVYFATSVEYGKYDTNNPGTSVYRLVDNGNGSVGTKKDANHHYTCNETTANGICTQVRYYYYDNYYITLTGGELIEDAIYKMTGNVVNQNINVVTRNQGYILNNTDSTAKTIIESWFRTNLTNEEDSTKKNYSNYLEDTVYCNDRSFKTVAGDTNISTYLESGWNPNGGDLTKFLYFGAWNRYKNNWYSTSNVPSIACPNETDRFSVNSSIAHLNYPVGLLTVDEIIMTGASGSSDTSNQTYYLNAGVYFWSLTPYRFYSIYTNGFGVSQSGTFGTNYVQKAGGFRPVVSLKHSTEFKSGGDGTPTNPYVVKY